MTATIELEETHKYLRNKLEILGFQYPLPIGAISLVGALVDDLIKTTESLRAAKDEVINLREEKTAWDLGVEPYKCDNSRLLAECNALHQELLKEREKGDIKLLEITRQVRNLELDKKYLEEHCAELNKKLRDFESKYSGDASKRNKDSANMHKKPFVTAVRSGKLLSNPNAPVNADKSCFKMHCHCQRRTVAPVSCTDLQRLENDCRDARDTLETVQRQMDAKEREIQRLTNLLEGGRSPTQLARECCYKGIHELSKDLELLQKEKNKLQIELNASIAAQHEAMQRATMLEEKNRQLEGETDLLEKTALEVESKANMALEEKNQEIANLQNQIENLRRQTNNTRLGNNVDNEKAALKCEIKKINEEYRTLVEKLNECSKVVQDLQADNQKLSKKNSKLKLKLSNLKETVEIPKEFQDGNKLKENQKSENVQQTLSGRMCEEELARLRNERDYFQKEYLQIIEQRHSRENLDALNNELKEKNLLISQLRNDIELLRNSKASAASASQSVHATIHRLERERDALKLEIEKLKFDRNSLHEKIKILTEHQVADQREHEKQIQCLYEKLSNLEMEKNQILSSQVPTETTVNLLGCEIEELKQKLQKTEAENQHLKKRYNQIKVLQEQTERSLNSQQSKLVMAESIKGRIESKLSTLDSNREEAEKQLDTLKKDFLNAKTALNTMERDKDKLVVELDAKTERIFKLETDLRIAENDKRELQKSLDTIKKRFDEMTMDRRSQEGTLREATTESQTLRKQISTLKQFNDNAMVENNRLTNELGDSVTELTIVKRKLKDSEMEVEKLKQQLQQYVQEVKRVEDLLAKKDNEREEMLEHFRSLSHDAVVLEGNNHSLEIEATETKKQLHEAESRINDLEAQLQAKYDEIRSYEKMVNNLSSQIEKLELDLEAKYDQISVLQADLDASKDLIDKLDNQKDKLVEELNEHSTIRQQLQAENNKLKSEICVFSGSTSDRKNRMNELLESSRQEIDQHIRNTNALNQEVSKLRRKIEDLEMQLANEQSNSERNKALAHEYNVQLQELRQVLTNERFDSLHSKDDMDKKESSPPVSNSSVSNESMCGSDEVVMVISSPENNVTENSKIITKQIPLEPVISPKTFENELKISSSLRKKSRKAIPSIVVESSSNCDEDVVEILSPKAQQQVSRKTSVEGQLGLSSGPPEKPLSVLTTESLTSSHSSMVNQTDQPPSTKSTVSTCKTVGLQISLPPFLPLGSLQTKPVTGSNLPTSSQTTVVDNQNGSTSCTTSKSLPSSSKSVVKQNSPTIIPVTGSNLAPTVQPSSTMTSTDNQKGPGPSLQSQPKSVPVTGNNLLKSVPSLSTKNSVNDQTDLISLPIGSTQPKSVATPTTSRCYDFSSLPPPPPVETIEYGATKCNVQMHIFAISGQLDKFNINCVVNKK